MKVAYLTNQYPKTSHSFIRREIQALEANGFVVERVSIRKTQDVLVDPADVDEANQTVNVLDAGIPIVLATILILATKPLRFFKATQEAWRLGGRSDRGRLRHVIYLMEACWLDRHFALTHPSHVHVHFGTNPATVALLLNTLARIPFSMTCHGPEEFDKPIESSLGEKIQRAKAVVGVSSFGRSQLYRWCDVVSWPKIKTVHCGLDATFLGQPVEAIRGAKKLVCVGRLCEQKGQQLLVQAAARLKRDGRAFDLVLIGDGPMRPNIEALIREHELDHCVTITGWQNGAQVREHLQTSRALVLPSFGEGLPVAIMEAMAMKRPIISTYIAGIPELVTPECGWLVPAGCVETLSAAMAACLEASDDELNRMGHVGAERVKARHDIGNEAKKLAALFQHGETL